MTWVNKMPIWHGGKQFLLLRVIWTLSYPVIDFFPLFLSIHGTCYWENEGSNGPIIREKALVIFISLSRPRPSQRLDYLAWCLAGSVSYSKEKNQDLCTRTSFSHQSPCHWPSALSKMEMAQKFTKGNEQAVLSTPKPFWNQSEPKLMLLSCYHSYTNYQREG